MAEAFLNQLLQLDNSVKPTGNDRCVICLSAPGTICPDTGIVEFEIRLPCNHTVGSRCIATWLSPTGAGNNSCPVCRHVFFPAQPRPYLEHGIMDDDDEGAEEMREGYIIEDEIAPSDTNRRPAATLPTIKAMCDTYCQRLSLDSNNDRGIDVSQHLAEKIHDMCLYHGYSRSRIAAVSVYVTSHLMGKPRSLHWVSAMCSVDTNEIKSLYKNVRFEWVGAELVDEVILGILESADLETLLERLPEV